MSRRKRADDRAGSARNERGGSADAPSALTRAQRVIAAVSLLVWCACSLLLVGLIPRGDAPDEVAHLAYVDHLSRTWTLVDFRTEPRGTVISNGSSRPVVGMLTSARVTARPGTSAWSS